MILRLTANIAHPRSLPDAGAIALEIDRPIVRQDVGQHHVEEFLTGFHVECSPVRCLGHVLPAARTRVESLRDAKLGFGLDFWEERQISAVPLLKT